MTARSAARRRHVRRRARKGDRYVAAGEFKTRCLELLDRVRETGVDYIVTKHGTAVAKVVPCREPRAGSLFGSMKGTVLRYDRPLDPIDGDYDVNRD